MWFLHTHSEHCKFFQTVLLSVAVGQLERLTSHLPPPFFTVAGEDGCLQRTSLALVALSMSTFPLSAITSISPRESRYRCLRWFFLSCQSGYFSIHSTHAFTQTTSIKLRSSLKCQSNFDLVQVHSLRSLSWTSKPTFSDIILHDDFRFVISFRTHTRVVMMLWWEEDDSLVSCWYMRYHY